MQRLIRDVMKNYSYLAAFVGIVGSASSALAQNTFPANGNVGVGTQTPQYLLDVAGFARLGTNTQAIPPSQNTNAGAIFSWNRSGGSAEVNIYNAFDAYKGQNTSFIFSQKTGATTFADLLTIQGTGAIGIGTTAPAAKLDVEGSGNVILNAGNVGILNRAPNYALDVSGFTRLGTNTQAVPPSDNANAGAIFSWNRSGGSAEVNIYNAFDAYKGQNTSFIFSQKTGATTYNDLMTIMGNGSVGVNTTNPGATLDVNGGIRAGSATVVSACNGSTEGTQRYNYSSHGMEFCNGSGWVALSPSGTWCGYYDTLASKLVSNCAGVNPSSGCPAGYSQVVIQNTASSNAGYTCIKN